MRSRKPAPTPPVDNNRDMLKARMLPPWLAVFAVLFLAMTYHQYTSQMEESGCEMVWMYPSYAKLTTFTTDHSRMASKYSIHLYREGGIDDEDTVIPKGVPVLFIPGHAGSYRQARSIASYTAKKQHADRKLAKFDFFTADFTEDFTAFHGQTMLDQAEFVNDAIKFILSLYQDQGPSAPESVVIIGHSMGGVVARSLVALPNYTPDSINTILTLSTPHTVAPLTFDNDIITVYDLINQYWRHAFAKPDQSNPLQNMALISVVGGKRDAMVPADYCTTLSVVPPSHGFTTYASSIPDCWTSVDHLAMTWCSQMRRAVSDGLFKMVDVASPSKTKPLRERVEAFASELLSGLEGYPYYPKTNEPTALLKTRKGLPVKSTVAVNEIKEGAIMVPLGEGGGNTSVSVWTNSTSARVFKCHEAKDFEQDDDYETLETVDFSGFEKSDNFVCAELNPVKLPLSTELHSRPYKQGTMDFYNVDPDGVNTLVAITARRPHESFVVANGADPKFDRGRGVIKDAAFVDFAVANSNSLLSYKLTIKDLRSKSNGFFKPLLRQYVNEPYEAQFHVNVAGKTTPITFQGSGPYVPSLPTADNDLHIQIFNPPDSEIEVSMKVDWWNSMSNLALRYRIVPATMPISVICVVIAIQMWSFNSLGTYLSFYDGILQLTRKFLAPILVTMAGIHLAMKRESFRNFLRLLQIPGEKANVAALQAFWPELRQTDMYMGTSDSRFMFLGPVCFLVAIGLIVLVNALVGIITLGLSKIMAGFSTKRTSPTLPGLRFTSRRLVVVALMLILVIFFVPFQFAFVMATLIQLVNAGRALRDVSLLNESCDAATRRAKVNFANFNASFAVLFLWTSIVNAPLLVVWVHNLVQHLPVRFSSHHNIISIIPVLLVVENLAAGNMIPRMHTKLQKTTTIVYLSYMACYGVLYGTQHTYMLHHLVNILCGWLLIVYLDDPGTKNRMDHVLHRSRHKIV